jgi:hypothetical protein
MDAATGGQPDGNPPPPPLPNCDASHTPTAQSHPRGGGGGQRAASASWHSVPAPSGIRSRGEALTAVNTMFEFPPTQDMPAYEDWRACINALLEYARQCREPACSYSQSHHGPTVGLTNGPMQPAPAPAPQPLSQPAARAPEHVSIGSSAAHPPRDAREIINDRQDEDAHFCVERNHRLRPEAQNADAREAGKAALNYGEAASPTRASYVE